MPQALPISVQCKTLPISVTSTASTSTALPCVGDTIVICNEGTVAAFVSVGTGAQVATLPNATPTATSTPVLPGSYVAFTLPNPQPTLGSDGTFAVPTPLNISAITRSGTCTIDVMINYGS